MATAPEAVEILYKAAKLAAVCAVVTLVACSSLLKPNVTTGVTELRAGEYQVDKQHATVLFKVDHLGLSEFVGRFNQFDASLDFDPQRIGEARLEAVIQTASIDVNDPTFEEELRGRDWFDTERFPEAVFKTTSVTQVDENTARFSGELTLLGISVPVVLNVVFNGGANNLLTLKYTIGFSATTSFLRSDFGMNHYIPAVGDEIRIEIYAEFQRQ
jgi:polyisoprenoid-binding protein YceI